jgi:hypothetical protein
MENHDEIKDKIISDIKCGTCGTPMIILTNEKEPNSIYVSCPSCNDIKTPKLKDGWKQIKLLTNEDELIQS